MKPVPFHRVRAIFAAIATAMALPVDQRSAALSGIGPYRSRGKGRGSPSRNWLRPFSHNTPHQGAQERLRRKIGGWAWHKRQAAFYDPAAPLTKNQTLGIGHARVRNAERLLERTFA